MKKKLLMVLFAFSVVYNCFAMPVKEIVPFTGKLVRITYPVPDLLGGGLSTFKGTILKVISYNNKDYVQVKLLDGEIINMLIITIIDLEVLN